MCHGYSRLRVMNTSFSLAACYLWVLHGSLAWSRSNAVSDQPMKVGGAEIRNLDFDLGNIRSNTFRWDPAVKNAKRAGIQDATRTVEILSICRLMCTINKSLRTHISHAHEPRCHTSHVPLRGNQGICAMGGRFSASARTEPRLGGP